MSYKILVTGISEMLGGNIYFMLKEKNHIFGINHSQPLFAMPDNFFLADICNEVKMKDIIKSVGPDILKGKRVNNSDFKT